MAEISDIDKTIGFSEESVVNLKWHTYKINKSKPIIARSLKTKYRKKVHKISPSAKMLSHK